MFKFLPALVTGLAVASTPLLAAFEPFEQGEAAAVFPPDWTVDEVFLAAARADVSVVRYGATDYVAIVQVTGPRDARALRDAGAWLVVNAQTLGGCLLGPRMDSEALVAAIQSSRGVI